MSTALAPSVTTRDPKGLKFVSVVEGAYNGASLSNEEAQRVNETPGLGELVGNFIAENRQFNRFKGEEYTSDYEYPRGYKGPKPIGKQIAILAKLFGFSAGDATDFALKVLATLQLPNGAEGWFAIASIDALATHFFPTITDPNERLCAASNLILAKIGESRTFRNYCDGQLTPYRFRLNARTAHALDLLSQQQTGDILIVPGQFGKRHAGRSVRRAREVMAHPEFGAYTVAVGSMLLTHPERLVSHSDLWLDVPGDEFDPAADGSFDYAPIVYFHGDEVKFDTDKVSHADERYGSASLFLPQ